MTKLLKGGMVLGIGAIVTKVIGAIYRVPLTNFLGAEGIGIYQMVFPFYSMLLTISSQGLPSAVSKLIAEGKNHKKVVYKSIIAFGSLGFVGSLVMFLFAKEIAMIQGNPLAEAPYRAIAPSVCLVSVLSVFRGYFQGQSKMAPTAISQIIEQSVKLIFGLLLIQVFKNSRFGGAFFACLAVTISEVFALIYIVLVKINWKNKLTIEDNKSISIKEILKVVVPITLSTMVLPLSRVFDSFAVVNIIKKYSLNATKMYGIYTGAVESIVGVPVSICYGLAVAGIPAISKDANAGLENKLLIYTLILSFLGGLFTYLFSDLAINILYYGLLDQEKQLATNLLKVGALGVILLPLVQSTTSVLVAKNKFYLPLISLFLGLVAKIILTIILVKMPKINIYGTAFSDIACYFVATVLNLLYIIKGRKKQEEVSNLIGLKSQKGFI